jgi:hypothetical protein
LNEHLRSDDGEDESHEAGNDVHPAGAEEAYEPVAE